MTFLDKIGSDFKSDADKLKRGASNLEKDIKGSNSAANKKLANELKNFGNPFLYSKPVPKSVPKPAVPQPVIPQPSNVNTKITNVSATASPISQPQAPSQGQNLLAEQQFLLKQELQKQQEKKAAELIKKKEEDQKRLQEQEKKEIRNLTQKYNELADVRKQQEFIANKYSYYTTLQNNKLNKQLQNLDDIQINLATREKQVLINQQEYSRKELQIHVLKIFFGIMAYLAIILVAFLGNQISLALLLSNVILAILIYVSYVAWVFNFFAVKSFTKYEGKQINKMQQEIIDLGNNIQRDLSQYVNQNCVCPKTHHDTNHKDKIPRYTGPIEQTVDNDGYYYLDGSAPQERIAPDMSKAEINQFDIEWADGNGGAIFSKNQDKHWTTNL